MSSKSFDSRESVTKTEPTNGMRSRMLKGLKKLKDTVKDTVSLTGTPPPSLRPESEGSEASERPAKKKADVSTAPRAIDGGSLFEMLSVDPLRAGDEHTEPLPYHFSMPEGFKQLIDPQTNIGTNTFVSGQDSCEYLKLRGRMTVVDTTMSKIRQQMEWLHQELMVAYPQFAPLKCPVTPPMSMYGWVSGESWCRRGRGRGCGCERG